MSSANLNDILNALPPEQRAVIEASLKRQATQRGFAHVGFSQYYDKAVVEGRTRNTPSGIENPNSLSIKMNERIGRRFRGISLNRQRDNTVRLSGLSFPIGSVALGKDGKLSLLLGDTFTDAEKSIITQWMKGKYSERPASASAATTTEVSTETTTAAPAASASAPATADAKAIKVALIKAKVKPTDEI